jgi:uncharacterized protein YijF (DUF1287 family)
MFCLPAAVFLFAVAPGAPDEPGVRLVRAAEAQIGVTVRYDPSYHRIVYPNGDIPSDRGTCTDVLIRAYRRLGLDLQALVHEDMKAAWASYPKVWGLSRPDPNIDHRRIPNLKTFFVRHGQVLAVSRRADAYTPGDLVVWRLTSGVPHIGIVFDRRDSTGTPLVIHNIGQGTVVEDVLFQFTITGHYRYLPAFLHRGCNGPSESFPAGLPDTVAEKGHGGRMEKIH